MLAGRNELFCGLAFHQICNLFDMISVSRNNEVYMFRQDGACPHRRTGFCDVAGEPTADFACLFTVEMNGRKAQHLFGSFTQTPIMRHVCNRVTGAGFGFLAKAIQLPLSN